VISAHDEDGDVDLRKLMRHRKSGVRANMLLLPEVAADGHQIRTPFHGQSEAPTKAVEELSAAPTGDVRREPRERPIEMDVGEVKDAHLPRTLAPSPEDVNRSPDVRVVDVRHAAATLVD
jgi:hypothetical protein